MKSPPFLSVQFLILHHSNRFETFPPQTATSRFIWPKGHRVFLTVSKAKKTTEVRDEHKSHTKLS